MRLSSSAPPEGRVQAAEPRPKGLPSTREVQERYCGCRRRRYSAFRAYVRRSLQRSVQQMDGLGASPRPLMREAQMSLARWLGRYRSTWPRTAARRSTETGRQGRRRAVWPPSPRVKMRPSAPSNGKWRSSFRDGVGTPVPPWLLLVPWIPFAAVSPSPASHDWPIGSAAAARAFGA